MTRLNWVRLIAVGLTGAAVLVWLATPALAAIGEQWILPISHRQHTEWEGWTLLPGAGYEGTDAWQGSGMDWARIYWELSGTGSMGNPVPSTTELYTIEFWYPTAGAGDWQPIESQIKGVDGETWPMEPLIPWDPGGQNHQWIGTEFLGGTPGTWKAAGPGPHTPDSDDYNAGPNGIYMWLGGHGSPSWLYAKWDFGWSITRAWSALRVTQITTIGACCLPDSGCQDDVSAADCAGLGGTHQGYSSTCDQLECQEATGACCLPNSSVCAEVTASECTMLGGAFHGYNTTCAETGSECCQDPFADAEGDGDVDQDDFAAFQACFTGLGGGVPAGCQCFDRDANNRIDEDDYIAFEDCASGPDVAADVSCDDPLSLP